MAPLRLVLASASPRRLQLLAACGFDVEVRPAHVDEMQLPCEPPGEMVLRLAVEKAVAVSSRELVVAADTTVVLDGDALQKPADDEDARRMLRRLRGRTHEVLTGFCVRREDLLRTGVVSTRVTFRALTDDEIGAYVATGEPLDKAGAYALQGLGALLVESVTGSPSNVVGLPLHRLAALLATVGVRVLG